MRNPAEGFGVAVVQEVSFLTQWRVRSMQLRFATEHLA